MPIGVSLALAVAAIDRALLAGVSLYPPFSTVNVRVLFGSVAGATITVTAVLFWVRGTLVQLDTGTLSPRVLRWYLQDRFLLGAIGLLLGIFAYISVSLLGLPAQGATRAPFLTTLLGLLLSLVGLLAVVVAITNSVRSTQISRALADLARRTTAEVARRLPEAGEGVSGRDGWPEPPEEARTVYADMTGWVRTIDEAGLLATLPPETEVWLEVRAGSFVVAGSQVARVSSRGDGGAGDFGEGALDWLELGDTRSLEQDFAFGLEEISDIGTSALSSGAPDTTTALEAVLQLGAVLRVVLLRDLPYRVVEGADGRRLYRTVELSHDEFVALSFEELRRGAAGYSIVAIGLLDTIAMLRDVLQREGLDDRVPPLLEQAHILLDEAEGKNLPGRDRDRIRAAGDRVLEDSGEHRDPRR